MSINWRNIAVLPVAFLIRAPILLIAYGLIGLGSLIERVGGALPGLTCDYNRNVFRKETTPK